MSGFSGSGKTSTGSSSTSSPFAPILMGWGSKLFKSALPVLQQYSGQVGEALRTGGVNSNIPLINAQTSAAREGNSQSLTQLRQQLAASGLAGTSFGNALIEQEQMTGNSQVSQIGPNTAASLISSGVPTVAGIAGEGGSLAGTAAGLDTTTTQESTPSFIDSLLAGVNAGSNSFGQWDNSANAQAWQQLMPMMAMMMGGGVP